MDAITSVVGRIVGSCLDPATTWIKKELSYIRHYKDNMEVLRKQHDELETLKLQIEGEVEAGERKREMIGPLVDDWLQDVKAFLANDKWSAFMDENKIKKKDKCCFGLLHCNLKYRYLTSKRAMEMLESTKKKIKKMEDRSSRAVTLPGEPPELGSMPTAHSKSLASRESTLNEIMEALKDKEVHRIGIYGMGGVGKTTLIEEVARRAEANESFKVVIAEVSQTPDVLKMQQQIAERIGLSLQGLKSEGERARAIYEALKKLDHKEKDDHMSKKRTTHALVILDNMWKKLDLDKVGIPHGCKIALTTRSEDVCREMEAKKKFGLLGLTDKEATKLFLEKARPPTDHDDGYKSVTNELVKKCGGLPLAIVALANTLRDRNLSDWKHVADQLGKTVSARVGGPMEENVHPILEWSYNSISNKEKKKFFLLCCLFPLGSSIAIHDLMRYGAGLDLFQYINSLGEAIEQAHSWATELKSSSLLLEANNERYVRIHDIVREASISIAAKGDNIFHVGSFPRWLTKETFRTYTAISMTSEDNHEPLSGFEFPKLEMLLLKGSRPFEFSDNFFQGMKSLKVLIISYMKFKKLPSSITQLNNLQTLYLEYCELSDIFAITSLVNLLFLSLHESKIDELPKELNKLEKLKLLDLTGCRRLQKIPASVIAGLTNLEGLYMMGSFQQWHPNNFESSSKNDELDDNKEMASLIELKSLSYLDVLEMYIPTIHLLPDNLLFPHLSRFSISIGYESQPCGNIHTKRLSLIRIDARRPLQQCITCLLKETEHLSLEFISGLKNVADSLDKDGFRNLKCLLVKECSDMEYIVTANELKEDGGAFPKLETLTVVGRPDIIANLKVICHGPPSHYSFYHLKKLELSYLADLWNFWGDHNMHSNQPFFNEKVALSAIKHITFKNVNGLKEIWGSHIDARSFNELESLTVVDVGKATKVFSLDTIKQMQNLKELNLKRFQLAEEFTEHGGFYNDDVENSASLPQLKELGIVSFPLLKQIPWKELALQNLRCLKISEIHYLTYLFPASVGKRFANLEELDVNNCQKMGEIVAKESRDTNIAEVEIVFPHLNILRLGNLPALRSLSPDNVILEFPSIKEVAFGNFQILILLDLLQKFQHVKELQLKECDIPLVLYDLKGRASTILPRLRNLMLFNIYNSQMIPASLGSKGFAQLEEIHIWNCKDIDQVLAQESTDDTSNNAASTTIVLSCVKIIKLWHLPSLRSFSSENYNDLEFPSLEEVDIRRCPRMEAFSYGSLSTPRLHKIMIDGRDEKKNLDLNKVIKKEREEIMRYHQLRREEDTSDEDTETDSDTEGETNQWIEEKKMYEDTEAEFIKGETSQGIKEEMSGEDIEIENTEGETSQRIEEETSEKDTEIKSTEEETSQWIKEKISKEDAEREIIEGETSQRIEEETNGKDTETKSTGGEISQWIKEEMSGEDTETKSTEGETSQLMKKKTSWEDTKTESTGEISQWIEEETMREDRETKFIEGETSQGIEEETMCEDIET